MMLALTVVAYVAIGVGIMRLVVWLDIAGDEIETFDAGMLALVWPIIPFCILIVGPILLLGWIAGGRD